MVDYTKSKIYKITCSESGRVYYGATVAKLYNRVRYYRKLKSTHVTEDFVKPTIYWQKDIPCNSYEQQISYLNDFREEKAREALNASKPL